jgi:hypothetical protein
MKLHSYLAALGFLACVSAPALAHRDTILTWNEDGALEGLPPQFRPATLSVEIAKGEGKLLKVGSFSLSIGASTVSLPSCVTSLLRIPNRDAVRFLASWYHSRTTGPPYLVVEFFDADPESTSPKKSLSLHFDLETVRLTEVESAAYSAHESAIQYASVDFRVMCKGIDLAAFSEESHDR